MKCYPFLLSAALLAIGSLHARAAESEFAAMFNGRDLSGWVPINVAPTTFRAENDMIVCNGTPKGFLRTARQYRNYIMEFDWQIMADAGNSGLLICTDALPALGAPYPKGIEVEMLDPGYERQHPDGIDKRFSSRGDLLAIRGGSLVPGGRAAPIGKRSFPVDLKNHTQPSPGWNHYRVECNNGELRLAVNGVEVNTAHDSLPRAGYICLESEDCETHFKNLRIRELPDSVLAPAQVAELDPGFQSLFTGVDLSGWKLSDVTRQVWSVASPDNINGPSIVAQNVDTPRSAGEPDLWSEKSYRDFELRADWRLTEKPVLRPLPTFAPDGLQIKDSAGKIVRKEIMNAGDSGIYLRGLGRYQVNIWSQPMGSGDINEVHKDATIPAAIRQALLPSVRADAPFGKWNRFIITLQGDRVTVILNGQKVIDHAELPGIPAEGPIALQHEFHGLPIEFKNIYIRPL